MAYGGASKQPRIAEEKIVKKMRPALCNCRKQHIACEGEGVRWRERERERPPGPVFRRDIMFCCYKRGKGKGESVRKMSRELVVVIVGFWVARLVAAGVDHSGAELSLAALLDFKNGLADAAALASWRTNASYCTWAGVTCDHSGHHRVLGLSLSRLLLQGSISPALSNLTFLRYLDLSHNLLTGEIPIHLPPRLRVLILTQNHLHGPLPTSLASLPILEELTLDQNWLHGSLPPQLSNCSQLQELNVAQNNLTGTIPPTLGDLPKLGNILLWFNSFTGTLPPSLANCSLLSQMEIAIIPTLGGPIPPEYGQLQQLLILHLYSNNLSGILPPALSNCTQLRDLSLFSNRLSGDLPGSFGKLKVLQVLNLHNNSLSAPIPSRLSNCTHMVFMDLSFNSFSGQIPQEIGTISFTAADIDGIPYANFIQSGSPTGGHLNLRNNTFSGEIPKTLGNCSNLSYLYLHFNNLQGSIPQEIGELNKLLELYMTANQLTGSLPSSLGKLPQLQRFLANANHLHGSIPESYANLTKLSELDLGGNQLEGAIPNNIGLLAAMRHLVLIHNNLSGTLPPSLSNCTQIQKLHLNYNAFFGLLPPFIANFPHLNDLNLSANQFSGHLPISFMNATALVSISIAQNHLQGPIPSIFGLLSSLQLLDLHENRLQGSIPSELSRCTALFELDLHSNYFQGPLPKDLGHLSSMRRLKLRQNVLQGNIPDSLGNCHKLEDVDLSHNNFTGSIPVSLVTLPSLALSLQMSHNFLTGAIPNEIRNLQLIQSIDLSFNRLSGAIPSSISECTSLQALSLSHNSLNGSIPGTLGKLQNLVSLDISANNLAGQIPDQLSAIPKLHYFNVSHNHLTGPIPTMPSLQNLTAASFADNAGLCGPPLALPCLRASDFQSKFRRAALIIGTVGPVLIIVCLLLWFNHKWQRGKAERCLLLQDPLEHVLLHVTAEELEVATSGFNEESLLGSGATSKVYKAVLKTGREVAVKKFNQDVGGGDAEGFFRKECEILSKIRHRNLVAVLSTCCNLEMKTLVLEYMPNGSLEKLLFEGNSFELEWNKILNIALDIGKALLYLHHECPEPVIHCDLKPSNVLLDKAYTAHVSDFGLAKILSPNASSYTASIFRGSIGYIAPECAERCVYSKKGDMYSYGVVVLCLITQKQPTNELFSEMGVDMPTWVRGFFPERFLYAVSPALRSQVEGAENNEKQMLQMMKMALLCTSKTPSQRPTARNVVQGLTQIMRH